MYTNRLVVHDASETLAMWARRVEQIEAALAAVRKDYEILRGALDKVPMGSELVGVQRNWKTGTYAISYREGPEPSAASARGDVLG